MLTSKRLQSDDAIKYREQLSHHKNNLTFFDADVATGLPHISPAP
jgi:hypothetical protein